MSSSQPIWPEVLIFWGAGATAALGFPTTYQQGEILKKLAGDENSEKSIKEKMKNKEIEKIFDSQTREELGSLLLALGDELKSKLGEIRNNELGAFRKLLEDSGGINKLNFKSLKDRIINLRINYDWDALKRIIRLTPSTSSFLVNLFNIIDYSLSAGKGIYASDENKESIFLENQRLKGARNCLIFLINLMMASVYKKIITQEKHQLKPYIEFAKILGDLMKKEGFEYFEKFSPDSRGFYLFSYAIVSMNFEPTLLWLIFNSHREVNNSEFLLSTPATPLKLFIDLGNEVAGYKVEDEIGLTNEPFWYSFHESTAQRLNSQKIKSGSIARVGKFYFPHGNCIFRECPNCGKVSINFGDKWNYYSDSLFPVSILPSMRKIRPLNEKEKNSIENDYEFDVASCPYCGSLTKTYDTLMVMQTSFKSNLSSFLEETQKEIKVCLENAKHLVLLGYSFPQDDLVWYTTLMSKKSLVRKKGMFCSIVVGFKGEKRWLSGKELDKYVKEHDYKKDSQYYGIPTIKAMKEIFGTENIRAFTGGIPQVWEDNQKDIYSNIINTLYPEERLKYPLRV